MKQVWIVLSETIEFFEPSIFERIVGGINLMGVWCSDASFEKNMFLFVRASSANSKFRLFFSGFEVRCSWWCWRAVQRLFLLLKSSGRVYYDCYHYPKGVRKETGTGRGRRDRSKRKRTGKTRETPNNNNSNNNNNSSSNNTNNSKNNNNNNNNNNNHTIISIMIIVKCNVTG